MSPEIPQDIQLKVEKFFSKYTLKHYKKGQFLIFPGDNPTEVYYLVKGKVRQYDISFRGDEVVLYIFRSPNYFPMLLVVTDMTNRFFYDALTNIEVRQAPVKDVLEFLHKNNDIMYELLQRAFLSMDGMVQRIAHLLGGSSKSRVLFELLLEVRRSGEVKEKGNYVIQLSETELATRVGLTRETVNREIRKLKNQGHLEVKYKKMYLKHIAVLEKELGSRL